VVAVRQDLAAEQDLAVGLHQHDVGALNIRVRERRGNHAAGAEGLVDGAVGVEPDGRERAVGPVRPRRLAGPQVLAIGLDGQARP